MWGVVGHSLLSIPKYFLFLTRYSMISLARCHQYATDLAVSVLRQTSKLLARSVSKMSNWRLQWLLKKFRDISSIGERIRQGASVSLGVPKRFSSSL